MHTSTRSMMGLGIVGLIGLGLGCSEVTTPDSTPMGVSNAGSTGMAGTIGNAGMLPAGSMAMPMAGNGQPAPDSAGTTGMGAAGMTAAGSTAAGSMAPPSDDAGTMPVDDGGTVMPTGNMLPMVDTTDGPGSFHSVEKVMNTPPGGWMIYPTDIGRDGIKHPLFIFGPGGGTTPSTYETSGMHWDRYGSYGFVIYVLPRSTGDGAAMREGLDWLIAQNDEPSSPLYQHLDTTKVCAAGHSMGSVTTFDFMPDERVTTTIHISGGSFDGMGPSRLRSETMFICAPDGSGDPAKPQCDGDFASSTVPTFYTVIDGADHLTSGRLGWGAIIAWMLWHIGGQEERWKKEFLEAGGEFQSGIYSSQIKNW